MQFKYFYLTHDVPVYVIYIKQVVIQTFKCKLLSYAEKWLLVFK